MVAALCRPRGKVGLRHETGASSIPSGTLGFPPLFYSLPAGPLEVCSYFCWQRDAPQLREGQWP